MFSRKFGIIIGVVLLVFAALYGAVVVPIPTGSKAAASDADAVYAATGTHPVGIETTQIEDEAPLDIVIWYPAAADHTATYTYPVGIKMGTPFDPVTVATYSGNAAASVPYADTTEPYPLVILSPGFVMAATSYGWLAEHLTSYGFVVIAVDHMEQFDNEYNGLWMTPATRPYDILTVLDYVDQQTMPGGKLEMLIDTERVAVMGHSYGGYTTLAVGGAQIDTTAFRQHCADARVTEHDAVWLCDEIEPHLSEMAALAGLDALPDGLWSLPADPRIDVLVPMAGDAYLFGEAGLAEITVPVLAIGGTTDTDTPYVWGTQLTYDNVSSERKVLVGLEGAEHMVFTGNCEAIPLLMRLMSDEFCNNGDWDNRYAAHDIVKHYATAFLLAELVQDTDAAAALTPDADQLLHTTYAAVGY